MHEECTLKPQNKQALSGRRLGSERAEGSSCSHRKENETQAYMRRKWLCCNHAYSESEPVCVLSCLNRVHTLISDVFEIHFNVIPSAPLSPKWSGLVWVSD
jgi:hypothetical protein